MRLGCTGLTYVKLKPEFPTESFALLEVRCPSSKTSIEKEVMGLHGPSVKVLVLSLHAWDRLNAGPDQMQ